MNRRRFPVRTGVLVAFGLAAVAAVRAIATLRAAPSLQEDPNSGGPIADGQAPVWEPSALAALAAWEPSRPSSRALRVAAVLWAAPLSAAGLLCGLGSLRRPRPRDGILLFSHARGLTAAVLRRRGFAAATLGHVVVALDEPGPALIAHELLHVRQAERLGVLMAPAYLGLMAPYGYARHPMERAARRVGARVQPRPAAPPRPPNGSSRSG